MKYMKFSIMMSCGQKEILTYLWDRLKYYGDKSSKSFFFDVEL